MKGDWHACVARKAATDVEHHHVEPEVASLVEHHTGLFESGCHGLWLQATASNVKTDAFNVQLNAFGTAQEMDGLGGLHTGLYAQIPKAFTFAWRKDTENQSTYAEFGVANGPKILLILVRITFLIFTVMPSFVFEVNIL
ncbi:hypothetical protein DPMN_080399 [Dreissena polymorpha]|uniref:Uncharacterized protein n=1 Tax=Dreissena polymorpha TaxID=45954 RepID=A0A9D4BJ73_DREPO|nr:hypothetical protein DPMN_080399 [Dreissena polymorpha]